MQEGYNIWLTLGGIGLLIYGMVLMEEVIRKLIRIRMQQKLEKYTKSKWHSFLLGLFGTGLTQSSSLTSLLLLVFVGAGIITLKSGIAVIIGANIGTTFTSLLVAFLGFGKFSITTFAFPLIGITGTLLLFVKQKKARYILKLLLSFGLIFFGIDLIKESVETLKTAIDFTEYAGFGIVGFFVIGMLMTAIIQSSHTVVIMTLAALHGGIITFPMALGVVIGSNIGTTVTVLFASLGGSLEKRRIAYSHLGFNVILSTIGLLYYKQLAHLIEILGITSPVLAIAVFNTVLNAITACIVLPFLDQFVGYVERYSKKIGPVKTLHITRVKNNITVLDSESFSTLQLRAMSLDINTVARQALQYVLALFDATLQSEAIVAKPYQQEKHKQVYENLKQDVDSMLAGLLGLQKEELSHEEQQKHQYIEKSLTECIEVVKHAKGIWEDMDKLREVASLSDSDGLHLYYTQWQRFIGDFCVAMNQHLTGRHTDHERCRELRTAMKAQSDHKNYESKTFFDKDEITKVTTLVPLSTLFNIDRQLNYIIKDALKARKYMIRLTSLTSVQSGYKSLVRDYYTD